MQGIQKNTVERERERERETTRRKIEKDRKEEVCNDNFKKENGMGKKKVKVDETEIKKWSLKSLWEH